MSNMSERELEEMATRFGAPAGGRVTGEQIRVARESLKTLKPEQLEKLAAMQAGACNRFLMFACMCAGAALSGLQLCCSRKQC